MSKEYYSNWSNNIYPCPDKSCDYIGPLDAFNWGECYDPCPRCGHKLGNRRTGRFVYAKRHLFNWLPFIKVKKFLRVDWR